ncbi:hypothetical protein BOTBODRAFT_162109 [Botryobasidium botryosum FD-172 SS1]|uniref:Fungal-type protein kinase domain-containing protein n=1 Tax=Botryobasidium botryosum (strain FD-172 SS1) TaxID=930990 RepID=A0A067M8T0_BOTB1|nr:hypothetical protein BOTBODRAFT_162109 [Botryobasidium botryosum FD-172 SS1]
MIAVFKKLYLTPVFFLTLLHWPGHFNYSLRNFLHRGVSEGNIMLLAYPEERPALKEFDVTEEITTCLGMLIDGDLAERIDLPKDESPRLGTVLPFVSTTPLTAWIENAQAQHTPLDDIESFVWVKF